AFACIAESNASVISNGSISTIAGNSRTHLARGALLSRCLDMPIPAIFGELAMCAMSEASCRAVSTEAVVTRGCGTGRSSEQGGRMLMDSLLATTDDLWLKFRKRFSETSKPVRNVIDSASIKA